VAICGERGGNGWIKKRLNFAVDSLFWIFLNSENELCLQNKN
jgi:hypothetical protein